MKAFLFVDEWMDSELGVYVFFSLKCDRVRVCVCVVGLLRLLFFWCVWLMKVFLMTEFCVCFF